MIVILFASLIAKYMNFATFYNFLMILFCI
jgi:hypothetical protein